MHIPKIQDFDTTEGVDECCQAKERRPLYKPKESATSAKHSDTSEQEVEDYVLVYNEEGINDKDDYYDEDFVSHQLDSDDVGVYSSNW